MLALITLPPEWVSVSDSSTNQRDWWREATIYEIYPRSFNDADGDGVGDIPGIIEKIDYLEDLGVKGIWLTPVYDSPLADFGYDIREYREILPEYGRMADWKRLRDRLHERDMRLIMDLVVNHTSDEHEWFRQSRRRVDPYTDYYIWRDGVDGGRPNNWESIFGGPAWTYDEQRGQYYLHLFDPKQPDLNWEHPGVRAGVQDVMQWWLDRRVDGFRMDVINFISKPEGLPDGDPSDVVTGSEHFINGPKVLEYLEGLAESVLSEYDVLTVGEMPGVSVEQASSYAGEDRPLDMVFHFEHMRLDTGEGPWEFEDWSLDGLKETITRWQEGLYPDSWNALYLNNHDQPRQVSRFGDDERYRFESATLLGTLLHTLRGTPFVYQGEEIGMTNVPFEGPDELEDVESIRYVERMLARDDVDGFADISDAVVYGSRDNARTPMQWSDELNAGFSTDEPWMTVNPNYRRINVERDRTSDRSIWRYYRKLIELRANTPALVDGRYSLLLADHPRLFSYLRTSDDARMLVLLNVAARNTTLSPGNWIEFEEATTVLGNYDPPALTQEPIELRPYEASIYALDRHQ